MEQITTKVKKWGNSFGIILPRKLIDAEKIQEGTEIEISLSLKNKTKGKDIFGLLKGKIKKPTKQIMKEVDKELWDIVICYNRNCQRKSKL